MEVQNTHQVTAPIARILPTEEVGSKGFKKRKFYLNVTTNPDWPNGCELEMQKDNCALLDNFKVGDVVTVTFSLEGRTHTFPDGTKKFYPTVRAWKINLASEQPTPAPTQTTNVYAPVVVETATVIQNDDDDLPF